MGPNIRRAAAGRADLVRLLHALPKAEWSAVAESLGFVATPTNDTATKGAEAKTEAVRRPGPLPTADTPPYRPSDLPDLPFWRVTADRALTQDPADGAPPWLGGTAWTGPPLSDPDTPRPVQAELVPRPRQARLLRRELAEARDTGLDLDGLCRLLAERRLPQRLPRRARPCWPARVHLVLDLALPVRPYWEDFWNIQASLGQTLGRRLRLWRTRGGDPLDLVSADGRPGDLPLGDGAVMILSDAGLYEPGSGRQRGWQCLGRQAERAGVRPLVLAPVPLRSADAGLAQGFRLIPWDRGAPLHPLRPAPPSAATPTPPHPGTEALLAALATASRVEPPLLRDLRLALEDLGADVGSEYAVWNHRQVRANLIACSLAAEHRDAAARALALLPPGLPGKLAALRHAANRHQSPLIRAEEVIADGSLAPRGALAWALDLVQDLCATLDRGADPVAAAGLAGYVAQLGSRRPELLARSRALAVAWVLVRREELRRGTLKDIPAGVDRAIVASVLDGKAEPAFLGQVGGGLGLFPLGLDRPVCHLAEIDSGTAYWQVEPLPLKGVPAGAEAPLPQVLRLGEALALDPGRRYRLSIGRRQLDLEAVRRPDWAAGLGRDAAGLFAETQDGQRLHWPGWARDLGLDGAGIWAEFEVKGVVQRMRWLPPGEFLMGSPKDEPERADSGEWAETQHPVTLTRGFWLADTVCTQALWRAVLDEAPSQFEGDERPVEQVSWEDVVSRFLPALNALVPGLDVVLPSEAQWEYACRAGTRTPFWFGDQITTDQVNYDGNYPYAGGPKGEYREKSGRGESPAGQRLGPVSDARQCL